mmetsp:Transcript_43182/g.134285  ORF Transcript_43182/g.134285 Transcript_43182/m.134285 type:complete len:242 (+) Transcript_43182:210-935(+)
MVLRTPPPWRRRSSTPVPLSRAWATMRMLRGSLWRQHAFWSHRPLRTRRLRRAARSLPSWLWPATTWAPSASTSAVGPRRPWPSARAPRSPAGRWGLTARWRGRCRRAAGRRWAGRRSTRRRRTARQLHSVAAPLRTGLGSEARALSLPAAAPARRQGAGAAARAERRRSRCRQARSSSRTGAWMQWSPTASARRWQPLPRGSPARGRGRRRRRATSTRPRRTPSRRRPGRTCPPSSRGAR